MYPVTREMVVTRILHAIGVNKKFIQTARNVCLKTKPYSSMYVFEKSKVDIKNKLLESRRKYLQGEFEKSVELFAYVACHICNGMNTVYNYYPQNDEGYILEYLNNLDDFSRKIFIFSPHENGYILEYLNSIHSLEQDAGYAIFVAAIKDESFLVEGEIDIDKVVSAMETRRHVDVESNRFGTELFGGYLHVAQDPADDLFMAYYYIYNLARSVFANINLPEPVKTNLHSGYKMKIYGFRDIIFTTFTLGLAGYGGYLVINHYSVAPFIVWGICIALIISYVKFKSNVEKRNELYVVAGPDKNYKITTRIDKAWYKLFEADR